ncbi:unnamed protein product, partial [Tuber aestivum]
QIENDQHISTALFQRARTAFPPDFLILCQLYSGALKKCQGCGTCLANVRVQHATRYGSLVHNRCCKYFVGGKTPLRRPLSFQHAMSGTAWENMFSHLHHQ